MTSKKRHQYVNKASKGSPYRSGFEEKIARELRGLKVPFTHEPIKVSYVKKSHYIPDFVLEHNEKQIIIEVKGYFLSKDRTKHLEVRKQNPELDIRFVFNNSSNKLNKNSKTTYADWCNKHGFLYADRHVPLEWIEELYEQEK